MKKIKLINPKNKKVLSLINGFLVDDIGNKFSIINNIPRFVTDDIYTKNFGFQWNKFKETQIKKNKFGDNFNYKRFFLETDWSIQELNNINILEVGSGAGRFTKVVLEKSNANLYSIDSSLSVDANYQNNKKNNCDKLNLIQADINEMPFENDSFNKVFCLGVLQHTKNFKKTIDELIDKTEKGGEIVVDFYPYKGFFTKIHAKYFFRYFTKKLDHGKLLEIISKNIGKVTILYNILVKLKLHMLTRFLPICDIEKTIPKNIDEETLKEWIILDTFDMYSPEYDNPLKIKEVRDYFISKNCQVIFSGYKEYDGLKAAVVKVRK